MTMIQFTLHDVAYRMIERMPVITLFGRHNDKLIKVLYKNYEPYFFARFTGDPKVLQKDIQECAVEDFKVKHTKLEQRKWFGKSIDVIRITCNIPKAVPKIKDLVKNLPGIVAVHECDILFAKRFMMDHQLTPYALLEMEGEFQNETFHASSLKIVEERDPDVKGLAFDIEVYNPNGKTVLVKQHPIVMLALYGKRYEKVITWKYTDAYESNVEIVKDEKELIKRFQECVAEYDPDCLIGYFSDGFDLPYIKKRADILKIPLYLGEHGTPPRISTGGLASVKIYGRTHIDVLKFIRNVFGKSLATDSYSLGAVSKEVLGDTKTDVDLDKLAEAWDNATEELATFAHYNLHDARLTFQLFEKILPNIVGLTKLIRQSLYDVTRMSYSKLVEWFVMAKAVQAQELFPNKPTGGMIDERNTERAKGGFVFEPTPGLYHDITVFDYRSLYPTIIASHNISPDTMNCACCKDDKNAHVPDTNLWFCQKRQGFLSSIIEEIITARSEVKKKLKEEKNNILLKSRSYALKILANAFYGYLGFSHARWYAYDCVEGVTAWGRHHIRDVITRAKEHGFDVIYGDTDSIFMKLKEKNTEDALAFVKEVNKTLPGLMELEFEGFYPAGIFVATRQENVGAKKRYALINEDDKLVIKGFETVRRNFSVIGKRVQLDVLKILLKDHSVDDAITYVKETVEALKAHKKPISDVVIRTRLSRPLTAYASIGPHVAAAMRLEKRGGRVSTGTHLSYVIIKGTGRIRDRVRLPDEPEASKYDAHYYIDHQILPAVGRIFEVVDVNIKDRIQTHSQSSLGQFF